MASDHDLAFDRIKAFTSREKNDNIFTSLRPFLEEEIKYRYRKQLLELGVINQDLSDWISSLKDHSVISEALAVRLHAIRTTLNSPMHGDDDSVIENVRSVADQILDVVYDEL